MMSFVMPEHEFEIFIANDDVPPVIRLLDVEQPKSFKKDLGNIHFDRLVVNQWKVSSYNINYEVY